MHVVGREDLAAVIAAQPAYADGVRAWLMEVERGIWTREEEFVIHFPRVSFAAPPKATFSIGPAGLVIEALVDLSAQTLLVVQIVLPGVVRN